MSTRALPTHDGRTVLTCLVASIALAAIVFIVPSQAHAAELSPEAAGAFMAEVDAEFAAAPAAESATAEDADLAERADDTRVARMITDEHYALAAGFVVHDGNLIAEGAFRGDKFMRITRLSVSTKAPGRGWSFPKLCKAVTIANAGREARCRVKVARIPGTVVSVSYELNGIWSFPLQVRF